MRYFPQSWHKKIVHTTSNSLLSSRSSSTIAKISLLNKSYPFVPEQILCHLSLPNPNQHIVMKRHMHFTDNYHNNNHHHHHHHYIDGEGSPLIKDASSSSSSSTSSGSFLFPTQQHQSFSTQSHTPCSYVHRRKDYDWRLQQEHYTPIAEINVVSFNMLAPVYKRLSQLDITTGYRKREASNTQLWKARSEQTINFFKQNLFSSTDIIGLQEFWLTDDHYLHFFTKAFKDYDYGMYSLQRTGDKSDAVVILVKNTVFEMLQSENVYLCNEGDRVALLLWLRHRITGKEILVANTHLSFPHTLSDRMNQMQQMKKLTLAMDKFAQRNGIRHVTRLIMGDFNVESNSPVCDHLRNSGFYSCFEVHPPENGPSNVGESSDAADSDSDNEGNKVVKASRTDPNDIDDDRDSDYHKNKAQNKGNSSLDGSCPKPLVSFVSHRNHHQEEVGVDHIFVKPGSRLFPTLNNGQSSAFGSHNHKKMLYIFQNESHYPHARPSFSRIDPLPSMGLSQDVQASQSMSSSDNEHERSNHSNSHLLNYQAQEGVFVDHCSVLPTSMSCEAWNEEFHISDHRPVSASLIFGRKKT